MDKPIKSSEEYCKEGNCKTTVVQVSTSLKNHNVAVRSKEKQLIKKYEICPEMHVNEIHRPHNKHHKVSSLMKFHQIHKII